MGGKTGTTTQQSTVSIPPEVLARYNAVNARAEQTATTPFQPYSGEFVAPLTGTQQAGIANINQAQYIPGPYYDTAGQAMQYGYQAAGPYYGAATQALMGGQQNADVFQGAAAQNIGQAYQGAQPYQDVATGLGLSGAAAVNPQALTGRAINQYMSPYVQDVVGTTMANLRQQQQQEQSQLLGNQIMSGAFGGDRGRIAQANLARQQELATGQTVAGLMNQGYGQALQTAQQQQGQQLAAEQANRAARAQAGQQLAALGQQGFGQGMTVAQQQAALGNQIFGQGAQAAQGYQGLGQGVYGLGQSYGQALAGLGTQAQQAALQGAQAQIGAGTLEQQTQQALNQAYYNQFLQQQGYPFQIAQFLANIAMGTGALSGSTTNATTTQPTSFFSDRRLKDDVEKIGKTFDGQDIVRFKYKGEPGTRIGLIAQDVEKHHPEAVGLAGGYRTVDYDKATDEAAERGHFAGGGLAGYSSEGGAVLPEMAGMGFAAGGTPDVNALLAEILNAHQGMYPYGKSGLYGQTSGKGGPYGTSQMQLPSRSLMRAELARPAAQEGAGQQFNQAMSTARNIGSLAEGAQGAYRWGQQQLAGSPQGPTQSGAPVGSNPETQTRDYQEAMRIARENDARNAVNQSVDTPPVGDVPNYAVDTSAVGDSSSFLGFKSGGLVHEGYAMGGMPYANPENDFVPDEEMKGLNPSDLQKLQKEMGAKLVGQPGEMQDPTMRDLMNIGRMAATVAAFAKNGGAIRGGYAVGGMPYSEGNGYIPEDIYTPVKPGGLQSSGQGGSGPGAKSGMGPDIMKGLGAIGSAASGAKALGQGAEFIAGLFSYGGAAGRHGYATDGAVNEVSPDYAGTEASTDEVNARNLRNLVRAGLVAPQPGLDPYGADRETTARHEGGRPESRNPTPGSTSSGPLGITTGMWNQYAPSLGLNPEDRNTHAGQARVYNAFRSRLEGQHGPLTGPQVNAAWMLGEGGYNAFRQADPNANAFEIYSSVAGPEVARRAFSQNGELLRPDMTVAQALEAAATRRAPARSENPVASTQRQENPGYTPRGLAPDTSTEMFQRAIAPVRREEPDWMQRNQGWLVPILSGLGAMASSPSRYLGSALLQGLAGGATQYAAMQNKAEEQMQERERLGVSRAQAITQERQAATQEQLRGVELLKYIQSMYTPVQRINPATGQYQTYYRDTAGNFLDEQQYRDRMGGLATRVLQNTPARAEDLYGPSRGATTTGAVIAPRTEAPAVSANAPAVTAAPERPAVAPTTAPPATAASPAVEGERRTEISGPALSLLPNQNNPVWMRNHAETLRSRAQSAIDQGVARQDSPQVSADFAEANRLTEAANKIEQGELIPRRRDNTEELYWHNQRIRREEDARRQLAAAEAEERAKAEEQYGPRVSPSGDVYRPPVRPQAPTEREPAAAPAPTIPPQQRPQRAEIPAASNDVRTALPAIPQGTEGGIPRPNIPAGATMTQISPMTQAILDRDKELIPALTNTRSVDEMIHRYQAMGRALQLFQSGAGSNMTGVAAAYARALGYDNLASQLAGGQINAQQWLEKEGVIGTLRELAANNPRFAQSEFQAVSQRGTPSPELTPEANHRLIVSGLSLMLRERQFQSDWADAERMGWRSPSVFYNEWSRLNPLGAFEQAAERQVGNLRGMPLPSSASDWVPGNTYVIPPNATRNLLAMFPGATGGSVIRYNGPGQPVTIMDARSVETTRVGAH